MSCLDTKYKMKQTVNWGLKHAFNRAGDRPFSLYLWSDICINTFFFVKLIFSTGND